MCICVLSVCVCAHACVCRHACMRGFKSACTQMHVSVSVSQCIKSSGILSQHVCRTRLRYTGRGCRFSSCRWCSVASLIACVQQAQQHGCRRAHPQGLVWGPLSEVEPSHRSAMSLLQTYSMPTPSRLFSHRLLLCSAKQHTVMHLSLVSKVRSLHLQ